MNKLLLIFSLIFLSNTCNSQQEQQQQQIQTININTKDSHPIEWEIYFENDQIKVEYKFSECDPEMGYNTELVLLKCTNLTPNKLSLNWHEILYYDKICKTCDFPEEYLYSVDLGPNELLEGNCSIYSKYQLQIFSRFNDVNSSNGVILTSFSLSNLQIIQY